VCKTVVNGLLVYLLVSYLDSVLMEMVLDFLGRERWMPTAMPTAMRYFAV